MFCSNCGRSLADGLTFCDGCGAAVRAGVAPTPALAEQLKAQAAARSKDAWRGITLLAKSPVGGMSESFKMFEERQAIQVGIAFAVLFEVALFASGLIFRSRVEGMLGGYLPIGELTATELFKVLVLGVVPFISLIGASALARLVFRGSGPFAGDVYTAGAVLLPTAVLAVLGSLLGAANVEVIAVLALFALTYSVLMLYAGCSRIGGVPEAGAAPAVPIMMLVSAWITKIIVVALW